ncbi:MAG: Na+/H+ antiporter NhaA [Rhodanobacter sp.]
MNLPSWSPLHRIRDFMDNEASGGLVLMAAAVAALLVANSALAPDYFEALHAAAGPLSAHEWINDGLMAVFFLLVGLEIKREALDGELATWPQRILPGVCAFGGMLVPALIYVAFNRHDAQALQGWAIPTATDIAFALGALSLLGRRVPVSLKIFLAALAIIDDLGAVLIIAVFYTRDLALPYLGGAALVVVALVMLNRRGVRVLWPYLMLGLALWVLMLKSGIHATLAGVLLALTLPMDATGDESSDEREDHSPLLRVEHALHRVVPFVIVPIFGFANAGVSFADIGVEQLLAPLTLGVGFGLMLGKIIGVFGFATVSVRLGFARLPDGASWPQMFGIAALCGIGFTMSLFIGLLAFSNNELLREEVKVGILCGSLLAGILGWTILRLCAHSPTSEVETA